MDIKEAQQDKSDGQSPERSATIDDLKDFTEKTEAEAKIKYYEQMYLT